MEEAEISCGGHSVPVLLDGMERRADGVDHAWEGQLGSELLLTLPEPRQAGSLRIVFDSDLNRVTWENQKWYVKRYPMKCNTCLDDSPINVPGTIVRVYEVWVDVGNGRWEKVWEENGNYQQQNRVPLNRMVKQLKFIPKASWGSKTARVYALELIE